MSDFSAQDLSKWESEAQAQQQAMFLRLGDREWDEWDKSDKTILQRKVGFGMYGLPGILPDNNNFTGYEEGKLEKIKLVCDAIEKNAKSDNVIHFACIFVFGKIWERRFFVPVFKVKGEQDQIFFADLDCCIYKSWSDYLKSNKLPKCMYCYPFCGLYQGNEGQVLVEFGKSPACDLVNRKFPKFDSMTTVEHQTLDLDDLFQSGMFSNIAQAAIADEISTKVLRMTYKISLSVNGLKTLND